MKTGVVVATVVAALSVASPASAGLVTQLGSTASYFAFPGERNDVVITVDNGAAIIEDHGSGIFVTGLGCLSDGPRRARCGRAKALHVELDDGNDSLVARVPLNVVANGGTGNDRLVTGSGTDSLKGGDGNDVLDGGLGSDLLDGGLGQDLVDYSSRPKRVIVTFDGQRNDGEQGENDDLEGDENARGGDGPDVLIGDSGPNDLDGGPGDDALAGGGGADTLVGGPGEDGINADDAGSGNPGSSPPTASSAAADTVGCGDSRDRVFGDPNDTIATDCEEVDRSGVLGARVASSAGADPPVLGKSVVVKPISGVVLVVPGDPNDPGADQPVPAGPPVPLDGERNLPMGSVVDTRLGTVEMTTAVDTGGATQAGQFHSGPFQVFQKPVDGATADLALRGGKSFARCGGPGLNVFSSRARRRRKAGGVIRRLWSDAHGNFRTGGRFASATVRGTQWLTEDLCAGTLVKVTRGQVVVHDALRNRDVVVAAGEEYLARTS